MAGWRNSYKWMQRNLYTCLSSRWGVLLAVVAVLFFSLNSILEASHLLGPVFTVKSRVDFTDNIGHKSFEDKLCAPMPIDIVYTWVNGSDPLLATSVAAIKKAEKDAELAAKGLLNATDHANGAASPPAHAADGTTTGTEAAAAAVPAEAAAEGAAAPAENLDGGQLRHLLGRTTSGRAAAGSTKKDDKDKKEEEKGADSASANRFRDNSELLYSLRSIEKNAPWVRNIYIVTNGQIPNWLNLANPRVQVVSHADIFLNQSHLPVFSSPAIEANIHHIKGLSKKFVYFNDDVFFGREVWPDDFYTHANGQKVYLSWAVPNCNDGCPASWINDGVCDAACNVSSCDWDGRDCVNVTAGSRYSSWWHGRNTPGGSGNTAGGGSHQAPTTDRFATYCAPGCPDSWIGDRYCDKACTNEACGWDASDCGIEVMRTGMFGIDLAYNMHDVDVPAMTPAIFVNLTHVYGAGRIIEGSHNNADVVRTATISQRHKIMTLTFHKNVTITPVTISILGTVNDTDAQIEISFNITVDTLIRPGAVNETEATHAAPATEHAATETATPAATEHAGGDEAATNAARDPQTHGEDYVGSQGGDNNEEEENGNPSMAYPGHTDGMEPDGEGEGGEGGEDEGEGEGEGEEEAPTSEEEHHEGELGQGEGEHHVEEVEHHEADAAPNEEEHHTEDKDGNAVGMQAGNPPAAGEVPLPETEDGTAHGEAAGRDAPTHDAGAEADHHGEVTPPVTENTPPANTGSEHPRPNTKHGRPTGAARRQATGNLPTNLTPDQQDQLLQRNMADVQRAADKLSNKPKKPEHTQTRDEDGHRRNLRPHQGETAEQGQHNAGKDDARPLTPTRAGRPTSKTGLNFKNKQEKNRNKHTRGLLESRAEAVVGPREPEPATPLSARPPRRLVNVPRIEVNATAPRAPVAMVVTSPDPLFPSGEWRRFGVPMTAGERALGAEQGHATGMYVGGRRLDDVEELHRFLTAEGYNSEDRFLWRWIAQAKAKELTKEGQDALYQAALRARGITVPETPLEPLVYPDMMTSSLLPDRHVHLEPEDDGDGMHGAAAAERRNAHRRKLLDVFGDSLKHVNKLMNRAFGQHARKVPAHMPHMIDVDIMNRVQAKWEAEFNETSSHRFRHPQDMQYAFSYFYYMIHEPGNFDVEDYFHKEVDTDGDGSASLNELRTLATRIIGTPLDPKDMTDMTDILDAAWNETEQLGMGIARGNYTWEVFNRSGEIIDAVKQHFGRLMMNKHEVVSIDEVAFFMIGDNETNVERQLDTIRAKKHKFICLNDNMNSTHPNEKVVQALHDFFQAMWPKPSQFELPLGVANDFLYVDDYREQLGKDHRWLMIQYSLAGIVGVVLCMCLCSRRDGGRDPRRHAKRLMDV